MSTALQYQDDPYICLYGIPWDQYVQLTDALGEYHLRHTYNNGTLEMRALLYGVTWEDYENFLEALGDYNLRHTYDRGTLEMMSPRKDHDFRKTLLARMLEQMAFFLGIETQGIGSTTLKYKRAERGVQPDEAYYIAHEKVVRSKETYDPGKDPPPDLVIEVDVTNSSVERMPLFARLGVAEVWRNDGKRLIFYRLGKNRKYRETKHSVSFPFLSALDVARFLELRRTKSDLAVVRAFIRHVKTLVSKKRN